MTGIIITEFRIRYAVETALGNEMINAIVCEGNKVAKYKENIARVGYKLKGIDVRYRAEGEFVELDEGWQKTNL